MTLEEKAKQLRIELENQIICRDVNHSKDAVLTLKTEEFLKAALLEAVAEERERVFAELREITTKEPLK